MKFMPLTADHRSHRIVLHLRRAALQWLRQQVDASRRGDPGQQHRALSGVCAVVAILTSALTLASFIKFFGVSFLSRTSALVKERSAKQGLEVGFMMQLPQILLASCCVTLGLMPVHRLPFCPDGAWSQPPGFRRDTREYAAALCRTRTPATRNHGDVFVR